MSPRELKKVTENKYVIISVVGSHAQENLQDIFLRKQQEIEKANVLYWLVQSHKAKTAQVQMFYEKAHSEGLDIYCLFIEPAQLGGAKPTLHNTEATSFSSDNQSWELFPSSVKVTGKISKSSTALVFDKLEALDIPAQINLENYLEFKINKPVRFILGASTACCIYSAQNKIMRPRKVIGFGRIVAPSAVWLKK